VRVASACRRAEGLRSGRNPGPLFLIPGAVVRRGGSPSPSRPDRRGGDDSSLVGCCASTGAAGVGGSVFLDHSTSDGKWISPDSRHGRMASVCLAANGDNVSPNTTGLGPSSRGSWPVRGRSWWPPARHFRRRDGRSCRMSETSKPLESAGFRQRRGCRKPPNPWWARVSDSAGLAHDGELPPRAAVDEVLFDTEGGASLVEAVRHEAGARRSAGHGPGRRPDRTTMSVGDRPEFGRAVRPAGPEPAADWRDRAINGPDGGVVLPAVHRDNERHPIESGTACVGDRPRSRGAVETDRTY
jgi:hypothetical protein